MNSSHFTGRLVEIKGQKYKTSTGEIRMQMIIRLQSDECKPEVLPLRLNEQMYNDLMRYQPTEHRTMITAYLRFRLFEYAAADGEMREGIDISTWKLECTQTDINRIFTIDRNV